MFDAALFDARRKEWAPVESPTANLCLPDYLQSISDLELARCHWSKEVENERSRRRGQSEVFKLAKQRHSYATPLFPYERPLE